MSSPNSENAAFTTARRRMVREQLSGPGREIANPRVLRALAEVPRHEFVPAELRQEAYADYPLPIGYGQTISQPYIVACMTEYLDPQPEDRVLEVGTGSGYQAAVLARLVRQVFTLEIVEPLARRAAADLARLGYHNVRVRHGDGHEGWPDEAPFDAILVACAPDQVPPALVRDLREDGTLMIPVGDATSGQELLRLRKVRHAIYREAVLPVRFVPMTGVSAS